MPFSSFLPLLYAFLYCFFFIFFLSLPSSRNLHPLPSFLSIFLPSSSSFSSLPFHSLTLSVSPSFLSLSSPLSFLSLLVPFTHLLSPFHSSFLLLLSFLHPSPFISFPTLYTFPNHLPYSHPSFRPSFICTLISFCRYLQSSLIFLPSPQFDSTSFHHYSLPPPHPLNTTARLHQRAGGLYSTC